MLTIRRGTVELNHLQGTAPKQTMNIKNAVSTTYGANDYRATLNDWTLGTTETWKYIHLHEGNGALKKRQPNRAASQQSNRPSVDNILSLSHSLQESASTDSSAPSIPIRRARVQLEQEARRSDSAPANEQQEDAARPDADAQLVVDDHKAEEVDSMHVACYEMFAASCCRKRRRSALTVAKPKLRMVRTSC